MAYEASDRVSPNPPPISKGQHLYKHGYSNLRIYGRWRGMVQRCTDPKYKAFERYGGRGITVCERWRSFENFLADMGEPEKGAVLDRINNDGNYEPGNCRWVSHRANVRNKSNNVILEHAGNRMCLIDWAKFLGITKSSLRDRLKNWPIEKALSEPNQKPRTK